MFGTSVSNDEQDVEESAVMTAEPGENEQRLLRSVSERMQLTSERAKQNKLVSDIESQLIVTKKRLIKCETFQSESESQLVKDKSELQSAVARLQSLVENLSNVEKTKDEEIARLRQKRRALEKELDDLSAELESVKASSSFRKVS
jgi:chromosome segregation ATPase